MVQRRKCSGLFSIVLFFAAFAGQSIAQNAQMSEPLSPRIANYTMDVRLDKEKRLIIGTETLTWHNTTSYSTGELQFHLYYNAWRNDKSSYLNSIRSSRNLSDYRENDWAYCVIYSMKILEKHGFPETDVTADMEFIQPDDDNEHDRTVMRVTLPKPVFPGDTISVEIQWESKVPRTFSRTGVRGDYYFLAQWFPKVGVFEHNGTWNCHQFIQTEFYADFGNYDVKLTVPTGWIVGATGSMIDSTISDTTTTHHYYQEDVHDFAWVTTPHFTVHIDSMRFEDPNLPAVEMRLLLMPDHAAKKDRYFEATEAALKYYGEWFGAYPYDHVTIVDPAYKSGSGGMEYPTFFTGGTRWLSPPETRSPESVTIHEFGHGYWYGIVANNEFEHAWLDEGHNTYSHIRTLKEAYPPVVLTKRYFEGFIPVVFSGVQIADRLDGADQYYGFQSVLKRDPMAVISWKYGPGSYGVNSYNKAAMMLWTLENYLGWETFQKIMSTYYDRWKFMHPKPGSFFAIVNEVSGKDMSWFFEQAYYNSNVFDYAVGDVRSKPVQEPFGYIEEEGELIFRKGRKSESDTTQMYTSTVFARRWGEAIFPVEVKTTFANGDTVLESWDGKDRWVRFDYLKPAKVEKVEVDPEHILVLDINYTNNSWVSEPTAKAASYIWMSKWMIWLQSLMEFFSFFS